MKVTRTSPFSGVENTLDIPNLTEEQLAAYNTGQYLIQDVVPHLTPDEREFIKTGITAQEWDDTFGGTTDEEEL